MLQYDFEESVGCWVTLTTHALRRALSVELAKENITLRQWEVLAWLSFQEEQSQVELAERLGIEAPTLAGILTRMERDGWLERTCCTKDRRKKRIRTTAKAESVWTRMVECCGTVRERAIEGIPAQDLACLKRTCEAIRQNLGETPNSDPASESCVSAPAANPWQLEGGQS